MKSEEYNDSVGRPSGTAMLFAVIVALSISVIAIGNLPHRKAVTHTATPALVVSGTVTTAGNDTQKSVADYEKEITAKIKYESDALDSVSFGAELLSDCKNVSPATWDRMRCAARKKKALAMQRKVQAEYLALPR